MYYVLNAHTKSIIKKKIMTLVAESLQNLILFFFVQMQQFLLLASMQKHQTSILKKQVFALTNRGIVPI